MKLINAEPLIKNMYCIVRYVSLIIFAQVVNPGLSWKGE